MSEHFSHSALPAYKYFGVSRTNTSGRPRQIRLGVQDTPDVLQPGLFWYQMLAGDIEDICEFIYMCLYRPHQAYSTNIVSATYATYAILGNRHILYECIEALVAFTPTASRLIIAVVRILHIIDTMQCNAIQCNAPQGCQLQPGF